ncbi:MAG: cytochrome c maturation protein CcmE [Dehalococcoidales bacterium]|jgi:cytochrome c-type biogenesis protein CcmE
MLKNKKFIIGGIIVLIAAVVLGYVGFMGVGTYYYNVGEFLNKETTLAAQTVRVSGILQPDPVKQGLTWNFTLKDVSSDESLPVTYSGAVPDTFKVGQQIVVEGKYDTAKGVFEGTSIIVKCASKYQPATT